MSFTGKQKKDTYKDILQVANSNNGISTSITNVKTGEGSSSSLSVSDRALQVKSLTNNTAAFDVKNASGTSKLLVDTTNSIVKANGIHVNTMYKEFGVFDFSPTAGYHYPLVSNNMMFSDSGADFDSFADAVFGNGTDPATSVDLSGHVSYSIAASATYWYVMDDISIDAIRVLARADGSANLNFHVYSYDLDTSTNHGDLSNGTLVAHIGTVIGATTSSLKTDVLTIDSASVSSGKVLIAFVENETDTSDISCQLNIKYHITG
tara:strand:+ start:1079 stop:1870 length:792 start_codon:yes stop_codon:yes gene_type:complete